MKLREFLEGLNEFAKKNPDALDLDVVTCKDDEGNGFYPVYYGASKGHFDKGMYSAKADYESQELPEDTEVNAVCVN